MTHIHTIDDILNLPSNSYDYLKALREDMQTLLSIRNPSTVEGRASIFEELNRKAKIVANKHNSYYKKKISSDFFLNDVSIHDPKIVEDFIYVKKQVSENKRLLLEYPAICVKAKGFGELKKILVILSFHKREKALEKLLKGDKRERSKPKREEIVNRFYIHNNYKFAYCVSGNHLPYKSEERNRRNKKVEFSRNKKKGEY